MLFAGQRDHRHANARFGFKVVTLPRLIDQQPCYFRFLLVSWKSAQLDSFKLQSPVFLNDHHKLLVFALNGRAQNLMPRDDGIECLLQRLQTESSLQPDGFNLIIGRLFFC